MGERWASIFFREHDGQDAGSDGGVCGVGRAKLSFLVVVVDLPEAAHAGFVDGAEIMLLMRVVRVAEGVEASDLLQQRTALIERHGLDTLRDHDGPANEGAAEHVIEFADSVGFGVAGAGHSGVSSGCGDGDGGRPSVGAK